MTLLVRCDSCATQYDASGRAIDSRFRCHCGQVVTVTQAAELHGHDAAVVRCSACGAPRAGQASACRYCHADFTLHERDLHTVCRNCLARVSDKARFCHSCAESLVGEPCAALATDLACPSCSPSGGDGEQTADSDAGAAVSLQARELSSDMQILECPRCAGMWLRNQLLKRLLQQAKEAATAQAGDPQFGMATKPAVALTSTDKRPDHAPVYRSCPDCQHHMRRHIFAQRSGIIIDSCSEHGIWFDADELEMILQWVRAGGTADMSTGEQGVAQPKADRQALENYTAHRPSEQPLTVAGVIEDVASALGALFFGGSDRRRRW